MCPYVNYTQVQSGYIIYQDNALSTSLRSLLQLNVCSLCTYNVYAHSTRGRRNRFLNCFYFVLDTTVNIIAKITMLYIIIIYYTYIISIPYFTRLRIIVNHSIVRQVLVRCNIHSIQININFLEHIEIIRYTLIRITSRTVSGNIHICINKFKTDDSHKSQISFFRSYYL